MLFFVMVTLTEQKWIILRERQGFILTGRRWQYITRFSISRNTYLCCKHIVTNDGGGAATKAAPSGVNDSLLRAYPSTTFVLV